MRNRKLGAAALATLLSGGPVSAQEPLAVIDWLNAPALGTNLPETILLEPPVTSNALRPEITVTPLGSLERPLGLVSSAATGLPVDLWRGSDPQALARLIQTVRVANSPAMQSLMFTLLLSESRAPEKDNDQLLLARLDRLMDLGAPDPTQALVEQSGPTRSSARFARWFNASLLTGDEDRACAALERAPHLVPSYGEQIFCAARRGDWPTAALLLETTQALETLEPEQIALLDRFLNPDVFEFAPPPQAPENVTPLAFRLFEAIGEPLPTPALPRVFAAADLRDLAGWKAQLEAAERLTHIGALHPNHLLGLFSARKPAASGGVWDRVAAWQKFEAALKTGDADAVATRLPAAWSAVQAAGTEAAFADLFSEDLARIELTGDAAELCWRIRLLAQEYELVSMKPPSDTAENRLLAALAQGRDATAEATTARQRAIAAAFAEHATTQNVPTRLQTLVQNGQLGEAILETMALFARGGDGDLAALTAALATFRSVGLEETARRAALQLVLLER